MKQKTIFFSVILILVLGVVYAVATQSGPGSNSNSNVAGKYDTFATCLKDKGAVFYGAFWCSHCKDQNKLFGSSVKLLAYVECSPPNASGQTQICKDKKIESYPTWEFADSTRMSGKVSLEKLAEKTSCVLPQ